MTEIIEKLIQAYQGYYNVTMCEESQKPLVATCDYFEHNEKYVLSRKANLWSADGEEFVYLYEVPHLTKEIYTACMEQALEAGMAKLNIGPGHMYSYITAVFVCETADSEAAAALKKSRKSKSFHFSLHGWMEYHAAMVISSDGSITANGSGRNTAKFMKKVLYSKK